MSATMTQENLPPALYDWGEDVIAAAEQMGRRSREYGYDRGDNPFLCSVQLSQAWLKGYDGAAEEEVSG